MDDQNIQLTSKNDWLDNERMTLLSQKWDGIKTLDTIIKDMAIHPHEPSKSQIDYLVGVWYAYTYSTSARPSEPGLASQVARNVMEISYSKGYFKISRWGLRFDHIGYAQYESSSYLSIHLHQVILGKKDTIVSPRHSLMYPYNKGDKNNNFNCVISSSWSFDTDNRPIGVREVYQKISDGNVIEAPLLGVGINGNRKEIKVRNKDSSQIKIYADYPSFVSLNSQLKDLLKNSILFEKPNSK